LKAGITLVALVVTIPFFVSEFHLGAFGSLALLALSGFVGLTLGDFFLLSAFTRIGTARTLILFGFQPVILGYAATLLFQQTFGLEKLGAVLALVLCLMIFSYEGYKRYGSWELGGLSLAMFGVFLDAMGILLTRWGFEMAPSMGAMEGHLYRSAGAVLGFIGVQLIWPFQPIKRLKALSNRDKKILVFSCLGGTYLSLLLFLGALRIGHVASVTAIAITGPLFATIFECIRQKSWPSKHLWVALLLFCLGFFWLLKTS
jgi:drug/metabolite transporter (DMT)-like permease